MSPPDPTPFPLDHLAVRGDPADPALIVGGELLDDRALNGAVGRLAAALKAIQENGGPMGRKDLEAAVKVRTKGKTTIGAWVGEACSQNIVVDGHTFVRAGRGIYGVEAVEQA